MAVYDCTALIKHVAPLGSTTPYTWAPRPRIAVWNNDFYYKKMPRTLVVEGTYALRMSQGVRTAVNTRFLLSQRPEYSRRV